MEVGGLARVGAIKNPDRSLKEFIHSFIRSAALENSGKHLGHKHGYHLLERIGMQLGQGDRLYHLPHRKNLSPRSRITRTFHQRERHCQRPHARRTLARPGRQRKGHTPKLAAVSRENYLGVAVFCRFKSYEM